MNKKIKKREKINLKTQLPLMSLNFSSIGKNSGTQGTVQALQLSCMMGCYLQMIS